MTLEWQTAREAEVSEWKAVDGRLEAYLMNDREAGDGETTATRSRSEHLNASSS